jgi:hypothetical protein
MTTVLCREVMVVAQKSSGRTAIHASTSSSEIASRRFWCSEMISWSSVINRALTVDVDQYSPEPSAQHARDHTRRGNTRTTMESIVIVALHQSRTDDRTVR